MAQVPPDLVEQCERVSIQEGGPAPHLRRQHLRCLAVRREQPEQWLVVRLDLKKPAKQVVAELFYTCNHSKCLFIDLRIVPLCTRQGP